MIVKKFWNLSFNLATVRSPKAIFKAHKKSGLSVMRPLLVAEGVKPVRCTMLGSLKCDMHDVGKNLVSIMLEGAGYEIHDGTGVPADPFVAAVKVWQSEFVGLSTMLTTTMLGMRDVIDALKRASVRESVKGVVEGVPLTEPFAHQIGANG